MPTRCNIIVQNSISGRNILYRHCDGYPDSGTGDYLKIVLEKYSKNVEEYDYESLTKQILGSYDDIQEDDKVAKDIMTDRTQLQVLNATDDVKTVL